MLLSAPPRRCRADRKWGQAYLKRGFFHALGETMPDQVLLATAYQDGDLVAGERIPLWDVPGSIRGLVTTPPFPPPPPPPSPRRLQCNA